MITKFLRMTERFIFHLHDNRLNTTTVVSDFPDAMSNDTAVACVESLQPRLICHIL